MVREAAAELSNSFGIYHLARQSTRGIAKESGRLRLAAHMKVMTSHGRKRKPSGSRDGGQFTHLVRGDGVVVLHPVDWSPLERFDCPPVAFAGAYREFDPTADAVLSAIEDDRALALLADVDDREVSQSRAEDLVWNALADTWEVPPAVSNLMPAAAAHMYEYRIIQAGGGVVAACARYRAHTQSKLEAEALFSPFDLKRGRLSESRREAIGAALVRFPRVSDRLWQGALRYATRR